MHRSSRVPEMNASHVNHTLWSLLVTCIPAGFLPAQHTEKHGVHMSPGQELHYKQGDEESMPVLPITEML